jgi:hypothetical protein
MAAMKRIPKFTAGMFKKKMPRFGASGIRMPSMPKAPKPRVKKFAEGGEAEIEEVIVSPEAYEREEISEKIRRGSKGPPRRNRPKNRKELAKEAIDDLMRNPPYRKMVQNLGTAKLNKGGSIDGCAIRGKTRGKFV